MDIASTRPKRPEGQFGEKKKTIGQSVGASQ